MFGDAMKLNGKGKAQSPKIKIMKVQTQAEGKMSYTKKDDHFGVGEETLRTVRLQRIPHDIKNLAEKTNKDFEDGVHYDDL